MNTTDILDNNELSIFIEGLRLAGYDISTTEFFAAQDLIVALAAQGKLPPKLAPMKTLLMPILCHSPKEQEDFKRHFDNWVDRVEGVKPDKIQSTVFQSVWQKTKPTKIFNWLLILVFTVFILLGIFLYVDKNFVQQPETPSQSVENLTDSLKTMLLVILLLLLSNLLASYLQSRYQAQLFLKRHIACSFFLTVSV
ncbi:hypothetical protein PN36_28095 [Candidatus Thiomargarita nelsonii]|uniref:Uncharacterized protein n=1 Tax=Candidatus Thiomargarita nelsonii TaxID=1003181 RepID=A0A0A6P672_9GAMM|nr:hypothetical protein PN36_28095 [Candidatus Thiomargarita nelsonii]